MDNVFRYFVFKYGYLMTLWRMPIKIPQKADVSGVRVHVKNNHVHREGMNFLKKTGYFT
jgi:hypothetical protein